MQVNVLHLQIKKNIDRYYFTVATSLLSNSSVSTCDSLQILIDKKVKDPYESRTVLRGLFVPVLEGYPGFEALPDV